MLSESLFCPLLKIHWAETKLLLPNKHIDILMHPGAFVITLTRWIMHRIESGTQIAKSRKGLAVSIIKEEGQLFAGIGVYTICEIFFLAGRKFSPFSSIKFLTSNYYL